MEEKFNTSMAEICQSKCEVDEKLAELKCEVATLQEKTSLDLAKKLVACRTNSRTEWLFVWAYGNYSCDLITRKQLFNVKDE